MTHLGQRLSALIDGELAGAERDRVLVHLARCEPCRADAIALRTLKRRMSALGETAADASLTHRLIHLARPEELFRPAGRPDAPPRWPGTGDPLPGRARSGVPGRARSGVPGRRGEPRTAWYLAAGSVGVSIAGLATAAFMAGAPQQPPTPRVTPAVYTYLNQHETDSGVEPATSPQYRKPADMIAHSRLP
jgi:anti-sigma factor RsiW